MITGKLQSASVEVERCRHWNAMGRWRGRERSLTFCRKELSISPGRKGAIMQGIQLLLEERSFVFIWFLLASFIPHTCCYIGGGTVIDPESLLAEIEGLKKEKIRFEKQIVDFSIRSYRPSVSMLDARWKSEGGIGRRNNRERHRPLLFNKTTG